MSLKNLYLLLILFLCQSFNLSANTIKQFFDTKPLNSNWYFRINATESPNVYDTNYYQTAPYSVYLRENYELISEKLPTNLNSVEFYVRWAKDGKELVVEYTYDFISNNKVPNWIPITILTQDADYVNAPIGNLKCVKIDLNHIEFTSQPRIRFYSSVGIHRIDDVTFTYGEPKTIEITENLTSSLSSLNNGEQLKVNIPLTGIYSESSKLYAVTDPNICSNPSINQNPGEHYYEDNENDFHQSDWITIETENPSQYIDQRIKAFDATHSNGSLIASSLEISEDISPIRNINSYLPENFYGNVNNIFKISPQIYEYAKVTGFYKNADVENYYYLYSHSSAKDILIYDKNGVITSDMLNNESTGMYMGLEVIIDKKENVSTFNLDTNQEYLLIPIKQYDGTTQVENIKSENHRISLKDGMVAINTNTMLNVEIFNIQGIKLYPKNITSDTEINLNSGIYFIRLNNEIAKIYIK